MDNRIDCKACGRTGGVLPEGLALRPADPADHLGSDAKIHWCGNCHEEYAQAKADTGITPRDFHRAKRASAGLD